MMNLSDFSLQPLINFFHIHPYGAGIITFCFVFIETLAVIGAIFPGAIIMPAIGFLIGSNVIPMGSTLWCAIAGAIFGDYVSYYIGIYFQDRIHNIWPFTRWPTLLKKGKEYFRIHGGKSVFIGRFVMVIRVVIPLIAGMMKMSLVRFSLATIPAASMWAVGYIIPGILLGALSLELPQEVAAKFTLYAFLAITALWLVVWLVHHFFKQVYKVFDIAMIGMWKKLRKYKVTGCVTEILADPKKPDNHQQLSLLFLVFFVFILFSFTLYQVLSGGFLTAFDKPIYYLLSSLRTQNLEYLAIVITLLGSAKILVIIFGLFFIWLIWKRYWYVAIHLLGVGIFGLAIVGGIKFLFYLPRPGEVLYEQYMSSFPSAHTALSLVFYGFLAVIITRESKKQIGYVLYFIVGILVTLIALSRLYLGVHWLTDIVGGYLVGLGVLLLATISYRRRHSLHYSVSKIILVAAISIFIGICIGYSTVKFHDQMEKYSLVLPEYTISSNQLSNMVPLYRSNRFGSAAKALNVKWIGDIEIIKQNLLKHGWSINVRKKDFVGIIRELFSSSIIYHHGIFPQLYRNKPAEIVFTKAVEQKNVISVLHLWASGVHLNDINLPLWVGSVEYYSPEAHKMSLKYFGHNSQFAGATDFLIQYLKEFKIKKVVYLPSQQPLEMRNLGWNGELLVVQPRR